MDVAHQREKISVRVDQECLVTALKEMSYSVVASIEVLRVGRLKTGHDLGESDLARLDRQVDMIVHQAIGQNPKVEFPVVEREPVQVPLPITIVPKNRLAFVATRNDVVNASRKSPPAAAEPSINNNKVKD
jgi:hypothetical protein